MNLQHALIESWFVKCRPDGTPEGEPFESELDEFPFTWRRLGEPVSPDLFPFRRAVAWHKLRKWGREVIGVGKEEIKARDRYLVLTGKMAAERVAELLSMVDNTVSTESFRHNDTYGVRLSFFEPGEYVRHFSVLIGDDWCNWKRIYGREALAALGIYPAGTPVPLKPPT